MYDMNQYAKDRSYQTLKLREAKQLQLAQQVQGNNSGFSFPVFGIKRKVIIGIGLAIAFVVFMLAAPQITNAQDISDRGQMDPFHDQMIAFRLGHYYYVTGEYDRAVAYYEEAIAGIPETVFTRMPEFQSMYWFMGDAQLKDGQNIEALASYRHYLELAGEGAGKRAIAFVQTLENRIASGAVTMEPLKA